MDERDQAATRSRYFSGETMMNKHMDTQYADRGLVIEAKKENKWGRGKEQSFYFSVFSRVGCSPDFGEVTF